LTVIVPADGVETAKVIRAAVKFFGPVYIRLSRSKTPVIYQDEDYDFKIGKGVVMRKGPDITIFACGIMVHKALVAAEELSKKGIECRVVNIHTIKPIDKEIIVKCAKETGAVVTVEEHSILGGLGGAVAEVLAENCQAPMARVGIKDMFGESGKPEELLVKYGLTPEDIVNAAKAVLKRKK
jgi:transketolase